MSASLRIAGSPVRGLLVLACLVGGCGGSNGPDRDDASLGNDGGAMADVAPEDGSASPDGGATPDGGVTPDGGACPPDGLRFGANIHDGFGVSATVVDIMAARHLTTARMDYWGLDLGYVTTFRDTVTELAARGITAEAVVFDTYAKDQPGYADCNADLATVEATAYEQTYTSVQRAEDLVRDWEMLNEIPLYYDGGMMVPGTTGQNASDWDTVCGRMHAANLRGMSQAIRDRASASGLPLRIILGTVDRRFGFLTFMEQQGVEFDVVGYHIYPWEYHAPLDQDTWFGAGGPLGQLALFNRPIHINEFNCAEIYSGTGSYSGLPDYENQVGQPVTEQCLRSVTKHLLEIANQTVANVESMHLYEIFDEPGKAAPENRFGLLYDAATPKVHLYLASAFAGGALTSAEAAEITTRGLLTSAQISAWAGCGAGP